MTPTACTCSRSHLDYRCPRHGIEAKENPVPRSSKERKRAKRSGSPGRSWKGMKLEARWAGMKAMAIYLLGPDAVCGLCELPLHNGDFIDADHIIPRGRGGESTPENLQLVHRVCHTEKHGKPQWGQAS